MVKSKHKSFFLRSFIMALSISALIGIFIFLFREFGETENRVLATTVMFGVYSLIALCSASIFEFKGLKTFSRIGMLAAIAGFVYTLLILWEILVFNDKLKLFSILAVAAVAMAQISLLLLIKVKSQKILTLRTMTISFIIIVALMVIKSTITEFRESELFFRFLGVFVILAVLGTVVLPILDLISRKDEMLRAK